MTLSPFNFDKYFNRFEQTVEPVKMSIQNDAIDFSVEKISDRKSTNSLVWSFVITTHTANIQLSMQEWQVAGF